MEKQLAYIGAGGRRKNKTLKIILYRHKEPELGLDCTKGFTLNFFDDDGNTLFSWIYETLEDEYIPQININFN